MISCRKFFFVTLLCVFLTTLVNLKCSAEEIENFLENVDEPTRHPDFEKDSFFEPGPIQLTTSLWQSSATPSIRGSYHLLPFRAKNVDDKKTSFELFVNTTGLRKSNKQRVIGDLFSDSAMEQIMSTLKLFKAVPEDGLDDIIREISIERHRAGAFFRFSTRPKNLTFRIEIPIVAAFDHLWLETDKVNEFKNIINSWTESGVKSTGDKLTDEQKQKLKDLLFDYKIDTRIGDIRLALETNPINSEGIESALGIEAFIPLSRPSSFSNPQTELTFPQDKLFYLAILADSDNTYSFLHDLATVFIKTQLTAQGDTIKPGVGLFFNAKSSFFDNKFDLFGRMRLSYLMGGTRYKIIPVAEKVIPNEFRVSISSISVIQGTLSGSYHFQSWKLTGGYDFYFKTREKITEVDVDDDDLSIIESAKAEVGQITQHKLLGELTYKNFVQSGRTTLSLGGDYTFYSTGALKDWSLGLSIETKF